MLLFLKILTTISLIIGIIVCIKGIQTKNILYKGGLSFFLLSFIANIYSLIIPTLLKRLIDKGIDDIGLWIMNLSIPPLIFTAIALIVFIIFLLKGLRES